MSPAIRYARQGDDLPVGPKALDDGSDGWWAGAQRCFVAIPLALALSASLAYGAQQQSDDVVPQPAAAALDDGHWPLPVFVTESSYISLWGSSSGAAAPAPTGPPDEQHWTVQGAARVPPVPGVFLADDEIPPPPAAAALADTDPPVWTPPWQPIRAWAFTADDEILPRALGGDGEAWAPTPRVQTPVQLSLPWQDDEAPAGALYGQAEEYLWQVSTPPWAAARPLYLPDPEEIPVGALFGVPEDTPWLVSTPLWAAPSVVFLPDPEELPAGALYGPPEDAPWVLQAIPQPRPSVLLWAVPDELAAPPAADEDGWQPPQSALSRIALALPWAASDEIVSQPIVSADDDAPPPLSPPPRLSTAVWWADEEIIPTVVTLTADDEDGWHAPVVWELPPRAFGLLAWVGDDETVMPPTPLTVDDDVWQILLPAQEWLEVSVWW